MKPRTAVVIAALVVAALFAVAAFMPAPSPAPRAGPAVKLIVEGGHGSGVVIPGGYILTAAHVATGATDGRVDVVTDAGGSFAASVLWLNKAYDVALLRLDAAPDDIGTAPLLCRTPPVGEPVRIVGSPLHEDFISGWGRVSGGYRQSGRWNAVVWLDMAVAPGDSGGPVYDERGGVVGIVVGMAMLPGLAGGSPLAMAAAVPASVVCMLMART